MSKKKLLQYVTRFQVTLFFYAVFYINELDLKQQSAVNF